MNVLGGAVDKASVIGAVGSLRGGVSALTASNNTSAADPGPTLISNGVFGSTPQQLGGPSGLLANLGLLGSTSPASQATMSKEMKFGLAGLLEIIRSTDKVRSLLCWSFCFVFCCIANAVLPPSFTFLLYRIVTH